MRGWALLVVGCGPTVQLQIDTATCTDINLSDPPPPALVVEADGQDVLVYVDPVFVGVDDVFTPDIETDGKRIFIHEKWEVGEDETPFCRNPLLRVVDPPGGKWKFYWYEGDAVAPTYDGAIDL